MILSKLRESLSVVTVEYVALAVESMAVDALVAKVGCEVEVLIAIAFRLVNELFDVDLFPMVEGGVGIFELLVVMGVFVFVELDRVLVLLGFDVAGIGPGEFFISKLLRSVFYITNC